MSLGLKRLLHFLGSSFFNAVSSICSLLLSMRWVTGTFSGEGRVIYCSGRWKSLTFRLSTSLKLMVLCAEVHLGLRLRCPHFLLLDVLTLTCSLLVIDRILFSFFLCDWVVSSVSFSSSWRYRGVFLGRWWFLSYFLPTPVLLQSATILQNFAIGLPVLRFWLHISR